MLIESRKFIADNDGLSNEFVGFDERNVRMLSRVFFLLFSIVVCLLACVMQKKASLVSNSNFDVPMKRLEEWIFKK